jgi:uncharacterized membrane protein
MTNKVNDVAFKMVIVESIIMGTVLTMGLMIPESVECKVIGVLMMVVIMFTCIGSVVVEIILDEIETRKRRQEEKEEFIKELSEKYNLTLDEEYKLDIMSKGL